MKFFDRFVTLATVSAACVWLAACGSSSGGGGTTTGPAPSITSFTASPTTINYGQGASLTGVFSGGTGVITPGNLAATSGVAVSVSPAATGTYTLTVTATNGTQATAAATVTVNPIITITPNTAVIGTQQQFTATASGFGTTSSAVTWTVAVPSGSSLSPGDISSTGLYNTPYPAPATVTVTATSTALPTVGGSATVTLSAPSTATGPVLAVDVNTPNTPSENPHSINPYVYGMNAYVLDSASQATANPSICLLYTSPSPRDTR